MISNNSHEHWVIMKTLSHPAAGNEIAKVDKGGSENPLMEPATLADFLSFRLSVLSRKFAIGGAKLYAKRFDLNSRELRIVLVLGAFGTKTSREIADLANMDKGAVSRGVRPLIKRELVCSEASQTDLRQSHLRLTVSGKAVYRDCFAFAQRRINQVVSVLSSEECQVLDRAFVKLADRLDQLNRDNYAGLDSETNHS